MLDNKIIVKPYTIGELADLYNVSVRTFRTWLKPFQEEIGKRIGHTYNVTQVRIIFKKLSVPGIISESELG